MRFFGLERRRLIGIIQLEIDIEVRRVLGGRHLVGKTRNLGFERRLARGKSARQRNGRGTRSRFVCICRRIGASLVARGDFGHMIRRG